MAAAAGSGPAGASGPTSGAGSPVGTAGAAPSSFADPGMPGVAGQLVRVLSAPRPVADGTYTVTVSLRPPSLGTVQATVVAGPDQVAVHLTATSADGADAIRQALPQLHEALSSGGQQATVVLAPGTGGSPGGGRSIGQQGPGQWAAGGQPGGWAGGAPGGGGGSSTPAPGTAAPARRDGEVPTGPAGPGAPGRSGGTSRLVDVRV